jgi:hypothetical protein
MIISLSEEAYHKLFQESVEDEQIPSVDRLSTI